MPNLEPNIKLAHKISYFFFREISMSAFSGEDPRSLRAIGVSSCGEHPVIGDGRLDTTIGLAKIPQQGQCVSSGTTREQGQLIQGGSREKLRT